MLILQYQRILCTLMDFLQIGFLQIFVKFLKGLFLSEELSLCEVWVKFTLMLKT